MSIVKGFMNRAKRVHYGIDTRKEFFLSYVDRIILSLIGKKTNLYHNTRLQRLRDMFKVDEMYRIKDVKLPLLNENDENVLWRWVYEDTYWSYVNCNDRYDEETFDRCDRFLNEGLYGLVNDRVNVTVEPGDIVIDAGAWIGDFAAYASVRGASAVYAFEPAEQTFKILQKTAELNKNIIPVQKGLSNENTNAVLSINAGGNSGGNTLRIKGNETPESSETVETVRLDDFVRENNIQRVDFIKADIEGFERHMLAGAQETLRTFAPKLALCTYHLPDDPQVMAELILKANPKYNIVQKRCKLFASVPE